MNPILRNNTEYQLTKAQKILLSSFSCSLVAYFCVFQNDKNEVTVPEPYQKNKEVPLESNPAQTTFKPVANDFENTLSPYNKIIKYQDFKLLVDKLLIYTELENDSLKEFGADSTEHQKRVLERKNVLDSYFKAVKDIPKEVIQGYIKKLDSDNESRYLQKKDLKGAKPVKENKSPPAIYYGSEYKNLC